MSPPEILAAGYTFGHVYFAQWTNPFRRMTHGKVGAQARLGLALAWVNFPFGTNAKMYAWSVLTSIPIPIPIPSAISNSIPILIASLPHIVGLACLAGLGLLRLGSWWLASLVSLLPCLGFALTIWAGAPPGKATV